MPRFDLSPEELAAYRPQVRRPEDFDEFWSETLRESRAQAGDVSVEDVESFLTLVDVRRVVFPGFGGDPIHAWLTTPAGSSEQLPTVVGYIGYGGGVGLPHERLGWVNAGYAHLLVDTRGQGSAWGTGGHTPDPYGAGPAFPGYLTRGIENPRDYYYRRVFTDGVLAVDAARTLPWVDAERVAVSGTSQGGGIALAVAGLVPDLAGATINVPFLSNFERAIGFTDEGPYPEVVRYLAVHRDKVDEVFTTLSYFDGVNFAARAQARALFSTALMDLVCPPSTVFAAYNHYGSDRSDAQGVHKDIVVYPFNGHEGGAEHHFVREVEFLASLLERT